jgi:hypothetical protein
MESLEFQKLPQERNSFLPKSGSWLVHSSAIRSPVFRVIQNRIVRLMGETIETSGKLD